MCELLITAHMSEFVSDMVEEKRGEGGECEDTDLHRFEEGSSERA